MLSFSSSHDAKSKQESGQKRKEIRLISEHELRQLIAVERKTAEEELQMQQITSQTSQLKISSSSKS